MHFRDERAGGVEHIEPAGLRVAFDALRYAVRAENGAPRTMFKPDNGMRYWERQ